MLLQLQKKDMDMEVMGKLTVAEARFNDLMGVAQASTANIDMNSSSRGR